MVRHAFSTGSAQAAWTQRRIAALLLAALGGASAAQAADEAAAKPLDLSLPRQAGQWTGVASRARQDPRPEAGPTAQQQRTLTLPTRPQPYGTGYEARQSSSASAGALGTAGTGARGAAASPAAPHGGHGKGR